MKYYYEGCPSWQWFYPFHYAPFASDLKNIERFEKDCKSFELGEPFKPVEQLMAVFPADSSHAIPKSIRWLMSDRESPIIDFYPTEIACDPNGKAMPWLWVVLLPFIDEQRLLDAVRPSEKDWSQYEKLCNARGLDDGYIYCHASHQSLASALTPVIDSSDDAKVEKLKIEDDTGIFGQLRQPLSNELYPLDKRSVIEPPSSSNRIDSNDLEQLLTSPIDPNAALCCAFTEPSKAIHKSILLQGAEPPAPVLGPSDFHIRRPRLNRGGGTIANMGTRRKGNGYDNGYGSMNISNYERQMAEHSGRGHQMNQAGTRVWGAMEPTAKRPRNQNGNVGYNNNNYNNQRNQQGGYRPFQQPIQNQNNGRYQHGQGQVQGRWQPPPQQSYNYPPPPQRPPPSSQPTWRPPANQNQPQQQRQPPRQGYNFQNFNNRGNNPGNSHRPYNNHGGQGPPPQGRYNNAPPSRNQQQGQGRSGVSANVMSNLRSQLASTLKKNRDKRK